MTRRHGPPVLALHVAVLALLAALQFLLPPFHHGMVARIMALAAYAIGYNILLGYTGLMSLGHALFFATGMYATGLAVYYLGTGAGTAVVIGIAASILHSSLIGLVVMRTTGVAFLVVTMLFAQVGYLALLYFNRITGGDQGFSLADRVRPLAIAGVRLAASDPAVKYNVALATLAACLAVSLWIARSPAGRVLVAIRENEDRTGMLGYNTTAYRLLAIIVSGTIAGTAGSVYAVLFSYVGATFGSILYSIYPLLWVLLGGAGTTLGPLLGTAIMTYVVDVASGVTSGYLLVVGVALILITMQFPAGILGTARRRWWPWLP